MPDPKWLEEDRVKAGKVYKCCSLDCKNIPGDALRRAHAHIDKLGRLVLLAREELSRHAEYGDADETYNDYDVLDLMEHIDAFLSNNDPPEVK